MAVEEIHNHMSMLKFRLESLAKEYFGPEFCDEAKEYAVSHPFIILALGLISVFSAIPVAIFVFFAVFTVILALICFVCVEGSIIIIGGLILIGIVSFITVISVGFTAAFAAAYWIAQKLHSMLCGHNKRITVQDSSVSESNSNARVLPQDRNRNLRFRINEEHDGNIRSPPSPADTQNGSEDPAENYEVVG